MSDPGSVYFFNKDNIKASHSQQVEVGVRERRETHAALLLWLWALACLALPPQGDD